MKRFKYAFTLITTMMLSLSMWAQTGTELLMKANKATLERRYDDAMSLYKQYIQHNPKDFRGYFNLGTTQYSAARYNEAINSFTKTLELNPVYKEAYYYRGMCNSQLNNHDLAIGDYDHVLAKDSLSVPFLKLRAEAYTSKGLHLLALNDLNCALNVDRLSGDLYKRRAELKIMMNDVDGAIRDYNAVEKLIPSYKMVHYIKGNLYLQIKETDFACDEYKTALHHQVVVAERKYQENCNN